MGEFEWAIGSMVHYVMPDGQHRPAIVVRVWNPEGTVNLQVFTDGSNDGPEFASGVHWATSVKHGEPNGSGVAPHTWHWPEWSEEGDD